MFFGLIVRLVMAGALVFVGWIAGSVFPAPPQLTSMIMQRGGEIAQKLDIEHINWDALKQRLSPEQFRQLSKSALDLASKAGDAIVVEHEGAPLEEHADEVEAEAAAPPTPAQTGGHKLDLSLCPRMTVSNAPAADAQQKVANFKPVVNVDGVSIATAPVADACLSSGFGSRNGRAHKGIDLYNETGGQVYAGGAGTVIEKKYRDDYGNMVLIDHGHGVYTRYAHLSNFADGIVVGAHVTTGQQIGLMGNTASYRIPVHLHYELLLGDYNNPKASFGLTPHSVFDYPAAT